MDCRECFEILLGQTDRRKQFWVAFVCGGCILPISVITAGKGRTMTMTRSCALDNQLTLEDEEAENIVSPGILPPLLPLTVFTH